MPVLTRLIPSPVVVDIRPGALDDLAGLLADQRISALRQARHRDQRRLRRRRCASGSRPRCPAPTWYEVGGGTIDDAVQLADDMKGRPLRRGRRPRRRQDHRLRQVRRGARRPADGRRRHEPRARRPVLAGRHPRQRRGPRLLRRAEPDRRRHRPRRHPRGPGPLRALRHRRRDLQHLRDRRLGARRTASDGETIDGLAAAMARQAGEAVLRHPGGVGDDDFLQVLAEALVLTGIAMSVAGDSRPASGACHEINHALRPALPQARRAPTASSAASARPSRCTCAEPTRSRACMAEVLRRHGLPVLPEEIGFTDGRVRPGRGVRPADPPGPLHHPRTPRPATPTRSGTPTPTMPRPSVAELRPVVHPAGVKDRRSGEHWARTPLHARGLPARRPATW